MQVSLYRTVSLVSLLVILTFDLVGFVTDHWVCGRLTVDDIEEEVNIGLWKACVSVNKVVPFTICTTPGSGRLPLPAFWQAAQGLGILSLVCGAVGVVCMLCTIFGVGNKGEQSATKQWVYLTAAACCAAGLLLLTAVLVFSSQFPARLAHMAFLRKQMRGDLHPLANQLIHSLGLHYSFVLDTLAAVAFFCLGVVELLALRLRWDESGYMIM